MTSITLALDWTPNTNHTGFFVAQELGFYRESGLELNLLDPQQDGYQLTPGKKLELGHADFAIAPFETVISLNNKPNAVQAVAVFALLQEDLSSIVTLKGSSLDRPKALDGKAYASYRARYEDHIVKQMIKNDGGEGTPLLLYPEKLGIWNTLLEGKADATWIFDNWEGIEAQHRGVELHHFTMKDFGIPYGYSPVMLTKKENLDTRREPYRHFVEATRRGYLHAQQNPEEAVALLKRYVPERDQAQIDLRASLTMTAPHFGDAATCGLLSEERVNAFLHWLTQHGLEDARILNQELYTLELLKKEQKELP